MTRYGFDMHVIPRLKAHPFAIEGLKVLSYDPKNSMSVSWYGQKIRYQFSEPIEDLSESDPFYTDADLYVEFEPNPEISPLNSAWSAKRLGSPVRYHHTFSRNRLDFISLGVFSYRKEVLLEMRESLRPFLARINVKESRLTTQNHKDAVSYFGATGEVDMKPVKFVVGYDFKEDEFYARYKIGDAAVRKCDRAAPLFEIYTVMINGVRDHFRASRPHL